MKTITNKEYNELKAKAKQWDDLEEKISARYGHEDENGEWVENEDDGDGLITIGEIAATAFGLM